MRTIAPFRRLALIALLTFGAGCDTTASLRELKQAQPSGNAFEVALAGEYMRYAEEQEKAYNWWTSKYFAEKGMRAAYANPDAPEEVVNWAVPQSTVRELEDARAKLVAAQSGEAKAQEPHRMAEMQVNYECWLQKAENDADVQGITGCRDRFYALLAEPSVASSSSISTSHVLYFDWDATQLSDEAHENLSQLARSLREIGKAAIVLNGHTDRSGTEEYNFTLSQERAEIVRRVLIEEGIPAGWISEYAFGETDPKRPTGDGEREPANRRVELFLE